MIMNLREIAAGNGVNSDKYSRLEKGVRCELEGCGDCSQSKSESGIARNSAKRTNILATHTRRKIEYDKEFSSPHGRAYKGLP
jgi:hypothetical protein